MGEQWERLRTKQDAIQLVDLFDSYIFGIFNYSYSYCYIDLDCFH